jgi:hypothetical protein
MVGQPERQENASANGNNDCSRSRWRSNSGAFVNGKNGSSRNSNGNPFDLSSLVIGTVQTVATRNSGQSLSTHSSLPV